MKSPLIDWLNPKEPEMPFKLADKEYLDPMAKYNEQTIRAKLLAIDIFNTEINRLAKEFIPEFHFMNHAVSRMWHCDKSPIGMCVHKLHYNDFGVCKEECIFCGGPDERK